MKREFYYFFDFSSRIYSLGEMINTLGFISDFFFHQFLLDLNGFRIFELSLWLMIFSFNRKIRTFLLLNDYRQTRQASHIKMMIRF